MWGISSFLQIDFVIGAILTASGPKTAVIPGEAFVMLQTGMRKTLLIIQLIA